MNLWLVLLFLAASPGLLVLISDQRRLRDAGTPARRSLLRWRQVGTVWLVVGLPAAFIAFTAAAGPIGAVALGLMAQTGLVPEPTYDVTPTAFQKFMGALSLLAPLGALAVGWSSYRLFASTPCNTMVPDVDAMSVTGRVPPRP